MMWAEVKENIVVETFTTPRVITGPDGVKHPAIIFERYSSEELAELGIYPFVQVDLEFDPRFYECTGSDVTFENGVVTEKFNLKALPLEAVKADCIVIAKREAGMLLRVTDWYITRKTELGVEIPDSVIVERKIIRDDCEALEASIAAAKTISALVKISGV